MLNVHFKTLNGIMYYGVQGGIIYPTYSPMDKSVGNAWLQGHILVQVEHQRVSIVDS
jgi:hypothetical protein